MTRFFLAWTRCAVTAVFALSAPAIAANPGDTAEIGTKFANTGKALDALLNEGYKVVSSHLGIDTIGFVLERQGKWVTCSLRNSDHGRNDQMLAQCFAMN